MMSAPTAKSSDISASVNQPTSKIVAKDATARNVAALGATKNAVDAATTAGATDGREGEDT